MTERELLLQNCLAAPADDTARLVYADRIQETGDEALAQLIRSRLPCVSCRTKGVIWEPPRFSGTSTPGGEPGAYDRHDCTFCEGSGWLRICGHEGCRSAGFACYLMSVEGEEDKVDGYYCGTHAARNGFCSSCGQFWGGIDSFEATGLCDHCAEQLEADYADEREWEDEEAYEWYPDEL